MSPDEHLDKLFESARQAEPILSVTEIKTLLLAKGSHTPKRNKLINTKTVLLMSILIILFSSLLFWLPQTNNKPEVPRIEPTLSKKEITKITEKEFAEKKTIKTPLTPEVKQTAWPIKAQVKESQEHALFPTQYPYVQAEPLFSQGDSIPYLILSNEALLALHIYTDGNTLLYINTKDSSLFEKHKLSEVQNHFYMKITYDGGGVTYSAITDQIKPNDQLMELRPVYIERIVTGMSNNRKKYAKVGDREDYILDPVGGNCIRQHYIDYVKANFIPVKVCLSGRKSLFGSTDHDMVFWFEPNKEFLSALPSSTPNWVERVVAQFDQTKHAAVIKRFQSENEMARKNLIVDTTLAKSALVNKLVLSNQELSKLGFHTDGKTMRYENKYGQKKYLGIYIQNGQAQTIYRRDRISFFQRKNYSRLSFYPLFSTSPKLSGVNLIPNDYEIPEDLNIYNKVEQAHILFNRMKDKLIPVEISLPKAKTGSITEVFWFEPTPEFLAALPKDQYPPPKAEPYAKAEPKAPVDNKRSIDLRNIKVIELTPEELHKFGITIKNKSVYIYSGCKPGQKPKVGSKPFYFGYNKYGTTITFNTEPADTSINNNAWFKIKMGTDDYSIYDNSGFENAPDTIVKFPVHHLVTDDLGQLWRSYQIDDQLTDEEWKFVKENHIDYKTWDTYLNRLMEGKQKLISKIDGYVPIIVRSGDINLAEDKANKRWRADIIIWYEPNEKLFNALPARIANDLRAEYQSVFVNKEKNGASCKYFEACKNNPGVIQSYSIFPNPTDDELNLEFTLRSNRVINASIYTVNGQLVKHILTNKACETGIIKQTTHINDLSPGMYLLVIESDKGDIISQRIVRR